MPVKAGLSNLIDLPSPLTPAWFIAQVGSAGGRLRLDNIVLDFGIDGLGAPSVESLFDGADIAAF
jgi:hypothetical protein